ncbi:hypothetical protein DICSQDRAFT_127786 [Dichomitus squalens LYAD-421 SS1]|uniref:Uncharacterized protein n=1 Tax=Dichomitus squalens (strain LYAD-421) TaxID=732165 RepID=R7SX41_DICSQ|nr:uncharacterized protein DICSQDRAFT_127786 [Dichomitus squalens LYAD-421 SS1]EJF60285.1 hypothetical protein DICSQDRAFT_127786 [Dichomitus squalens LYAD-421 SS1]
MINGIYKKSVAPIRAEDADGKTEEDAASAAAWTSVHKKRALSSYRQYHNRESVDDSIVSRLRCCEPVSSGRRALNDANVSLHLLEAYGRDHCEALPTMVLTFENVLHHPQPTTLICTPWANIGNTRRPNRELEQRNHKPRARSVCGAHTIIQASWVWGVRYPPLGSVVGMHHTRKRKARVCGSTTGRSPRGRKTWAQLRLQLDRTSSTQAYAQRGRVWVEQPVGRRADGPAEDAGPRAVSRSSVVHPSMQGSRVGRPWRVQMDRWTRRWAASRDREGCLVYLQNESGVQHHPLSHPAGRLANADPQGPPLPYAFRTGPHGGTRGRWPVAADASLATDGEAKRLLPGTGGREGAEMRASAPAWRGRTCRTSRPLHTRVAANASRGRSRPVPAKWKVYCIADAVATVWNGAVAIRAEWRTEHACCSRHGEMTPSGSEEQEGDGRVHLRADSVRTFERQRGVRGAGRVKVAERRERRQEVGDGSGQQTLWEVTMDVVARGGQGGKRGRVMGRAACYGTSDGERRGGRARRGATGDGG